MEVLLVAAGIFLAGWILGVFTPHILEPISRGLGTLWHRATRNGLPEHDDVSYAIHQQMKIQEVRMFFRIKRPGSN